MSPLIYGKLYSAYVGIVESPFGGPRTFWSDRQSCLNSTKTNSRLRKRATSYWTESILQRTPWTLKKLQDLCSVIIKDGSLCVLLFSSVSTRWHYIIATRCQVFDSRLATRSSWSDLWSAIIARVKTGGRVHIIKTGGHESEWKRYTERSADVRSREARKSYATKMHIAAA